MARSTVSVLSGATFTFLAYELFTGNENFHRKWVMPTVHRFFDAEEAHELGVKSAKYGGTFLASAECRRDYPELHCTLFGRKLQNPIGLAAGFDKNAEAVEGLRRTGFGFIEVGSVTPEPQLGNQKPRVFRLVEDQAVINSYGFNSYGADLVEANVRKLFNPNSAVPLGINIGKNKMSADAAHDYRIGIQRFAPYCDYLVINISSPNTPGLRQLQSKEELPKLLLTLHETHNKTSALDSVNARPKLLLKISPDNSREELKQIAEICLDPKFGVDGLIVSNTTTKRPPTLKSPEAGRPGGLSGVPLADINTECIGEMFKMTKGRITLIGCGGVDNGREAFRKIKAGASAVQLYTALVYQGFPVVGRIKRELVAELRRNGFSNVEDAVGADHKISLD